ncbi:MAG TPA: VOC family protein [Burkholderiales bacterium]|nr:VOC family protein [Burkholderiales bacterium]
MKKSRKVKKAKRVKPIPAGYHSVTPYLACGDAARAIDFYKKAFGATEVMRMAGPDGKVGHAEVKIGDSRVMLTDEYRDMDFLSPITRGGTTVHIHLYVADADKMAARAVGAGAKLVQPVQDKFYGDRTGTVRDPFGHVWHLATHTEDLSMAELRKRGEKAMKEMSGG